ncbi:unnamed protein product, partial [Adineta steineri]
MQLLIILLVGFITIVHGVHFRGGTITWRPLNNTPSGSTAAVQVRERWSWNRITYPCTDATIASYGTLASNTYTYVQCYTGSCGSWTNMDIATNCTDYSAALIVSSGEHYETKTIPLNISFSVGFVSGNWLTNLVIGGNNQGWSVVCRINTNLRPDGYINSSPIAVSLPIVYKQVYIPQVHVVQMSDFDGTDILRCRWATSSGNINGADECDGVCNGIPGASLIYNNCTLVFTLTNPGVYAAAALQIEDYYSSSSTTPMSSVPIQFLFYGYAAPTASCTTPPAIIGNLPNRACIGTPVGSNVTQYIIVQVYCPGHAI